jgi:radical SAM superfamily enzyme YgiQ (UPF0313 family)
MPYEGMIYRPPSEAYSFILQVTVGCSHNACTFCSMYKEKRYREKDLAEIIPDIEYVTQHHPGVKRVFLADGNALAMKTEKLIEILRILKKSFPRLERVGIYSGPKDALRKEPEELQALHKAGLSIVYLGVESGDDQILKEIKKGVTAAKLITAGRKLKAAGFTLSVTVIAGLGEVARMEQHATATAAVVTAIDPDYLGVLTLMVNEDTPLARKAERGEFMLLSPMQVLQELKILISGLNTTNCVFRSNHASNYLSLGGILARDRDQLMRLIENTTAEQLRPEFWRAL